MNLLHLLAGIDRIWELMKMHRRCLSRLALCCGMFGFVATLLGGDRIELKDGDRVAFLGGTLFDRDRLYGEIETALVSHFRNRAIRFRNLGWDGDTVFGHARAGGRRGAVFGDAEEGFERLEQHVDRVDPTVVFIAYGGAEAHAGPEGREEFEAGLNRLIDALAAPHRRFVLFTPLRLLGEGIPQRVNAAKQVDWLNLQLDTYRNSIVRVGTQRGAKVVDLFGSPELLRSEHRVNGFQLTRSGYRALGRYLVKTQCVRTDDHSVLTASQARELMKLIQRKNELFYNWWRPRNDAFVFGERKSEQVPVQEELPQFEALIADLEESIQAFSL